MTRWVRSGSSQKHKKMPGDATKWGEFDNQRVKEIPHKNKKNIKSQSGFKQKFQSSVSDSHSSKHDESFNDFFDEGDFCLTGNSNSKQENDALDVNHSNVITQSTTHEIDNNILSKETNNFKLKKMKKNQKKFRIKNSSFDNKNCEIDSDEVLNKPKKIKLENDLSSVAEDKISKQDNNNLRDFTKSGRGIEESLSQKPSKKKKNKKKYNKADSENFSSFDDKNCEVDSDEVFNVPKKIKLENDLSDISEDDKISKQGNKNLGDFTESGRGSEESLSQKRNKKKKNKKKYNKADSEKFSPNEETEEKSLSDDTSFYCSNEISNTKQDVECMNTLDKNIDRSAKKQKLKKLDKIGNNSSLSPVKNENSKNSSSTVFENKKEKYLKKLQRKREKLGLLPLPRNIECKLQKIKKRLVEKGFPPEKQKEIMRQARRTEELKYRKVSNPSKLCFGCREPGHILADCPKKSETLKQETGICFKCGSVEHTSYKCPEKVKGFPYAKCFICKEQGHISRDCPQNKHGVYPKGGRCKLCGNVNHLKKDCPTLKKNENEEENITLHTISEDASIDAEVIKKEEIKKKHGKKAKIVKF